MNRPWPLTILMMGFLLIAMSFPLQAFWFLELSDWTFAFQMMTVLNWAVVLALALNAYLFTSASRWLLLTVPVAILLVAINNVYVHDLSNLFSAAQVHSATASFVILSGLMLHPEVVYYLRHPNRRHWRVATRYQKAVDLNIYPDRGEKFQARSFDISSSGMFIPLSEEQLADVLVGESLKVQLRFDSISQLTVQATVVRVDDQTRGNYPAGIGCQFDSIPRLERNRLDQQLRIAC